MVTVHLAKNIFNSKIELWIISFTFTVLLNFPKKNVLMFDRTVAILCILFNSKLMIGFTYIYLTKNIPYFLLFLHIKDKPIQQDEWKFAMHNRDNQVMKYRAMIAKKDWWGDDLFCIWKPDEDLRRTIRVVNDWYEYIFWHRLRFLQEQLQEEKWRILWEKVEK